MGACAVGFVDCNKSAADGCEINLKDPSIANPTYPCKILAIIGPRSDGNVPKCQRCHNEPQLNGAPFSLLTWPDTQKLFPPVPGGKPIWQKMHVAVEKKFMPFCSENCPNDYDPPVQKLTDQERTTLLEWLECPVPEDGAVCP